jgi:hypothetical protein
MSPLAKRMGGERLVAGSMLQRAQSASSKGKESAILIRRRDLICGVGSIRRIDAFTGA